MAASISAAAAQPPSQMQQECERLLKAGDYTRVKKLALEALATLQPREPENIHFSVLLAKAHNLLKEYTEAERAIREVIERPDFDENMEARLRIQLVYSLSHQTLTDMTTSDVCEAIGQSLVSTTMEQELQDNLLEGFLFTFIRTKNFENAIFFASQREEEEKESPQSPNFYRLYAKALQRNAQFDKALAVAKKGRDKTKIKPHDPYLLAGLCYLIAIAQFRKGKYQKAKAAVLEGLAANSSHEGINKKLHRLQARVEPHAIG